MTIGLPAPGDDAKRNEQTHEQEPRRLKPAELSPKIVNTLLIISTCEVGRTEFLPQSGLNLLPRVSIEVD